MDDAVLAWLVDGDPSVAWQAERDLLDAPEERWQATRRRVGREGWAADLLALRDRDGTWAGGLYQPKWTGTHYTLLLLAAMGLEHPEATTSADRLLEAGVLPDGRVALWSSGTPDTCVAGMLLTIAAAFGLGDDGRCDLVARRLTTEALPDGGWNCQRARSGATHSSMHTTISVLEGLAAIGRADLLAPGHEFLARHRLYRSHTTGDVIRPDFTRFSFPPRWYYDVLRALDHLQAVDAGWNGGWADGLELLESRRRTDGRWNIENHRSGKEWFRMEPARSPSRWNTLRALRALRWAERVRA